jgi:pimeloyl-ACP methyl ester carboxylesterase
MKFFLQILVVFLVACVVFAGAGVFSTWAPDRTAQDLSARWAVPPSKFMPVLGMEVHFRDEGPRDDPLPIVLLHGTSASLHTWDGWVQELKVNRRVIRFDLPAFGLTGPDPHNDYSIAAYVRFVTAVLDKLGVQSCVLAGNSLGGQIAWATTVALPQRVQQLVLVDSAGYPFQSQSIPLAFRMARTPGLRVILEHVLPRSIVESSVRNVYGDPTKVTSALVDRYYELALRAGNRQALAHRFNQGLSADASTIKNVKIPTLILWGAKDRLIPLENGQRFASDIADSKLVVFDSLGHVPHEEDAKATVDVVKTFLGKP